MPIYRIRNISVEFPYEAYDVQLNYMEKVIEALQTRQHALLESPTGTGKTLCLLCSVLAWRDAYIKQTTDTPIAKNGPSTENDIVSFYEELDDIPHKAPPKVYFSSRTHSQLSQALHELRNTRYKSIKVCILGSREQMCINQEVLSVGSNAARTALCRSKVIKRSCDFYNNVEATKLHPDLQKDPFDIEDLVKFGTLHKTCPYFLSREQQSNADILFLPYNYLLDPNTRSSQNLSLDNSIIILDEAHNVESSCGEASSFDITTEDIAFALQEIDSCIEYITRGEISSEIDTDDMLVLKQVVLRFENYLINFKLSNHTINALSGEKISGIFGECGITMENIHDITAVIDSITTSLATLKHRQIQFRGALKLLSSAIATVAKLSSSSTNLQHLKRFYKVHIGEERSTVADNDNHQRHRRTLSLWCFNSGMAVHELLSAGVRNMILTSGTLAPLDAFMADFQMRFGVRLENPHVIAQQNVFATVIKMGPSGHPLNSSFKNRDNNAYQIDLGRLVVDVARKVPCGLLVFFPSYFVLDQCISFWKREKGASSMGNSTIYDDISRIKDIVIEPRDKVGFTLAMQDYYDRVTKKGAVFFAVCRGKVSEGVDFSDERGRAVIVTGLPFPSVNDARIQLKKQFLNEQQYCKNDLLFLTGDAWYKQQASRAVNQALGRVLRHANDHGAILLCDERFGTLQQQNQLPLWMRSYMREHKTYDDAISGLDAFFLRHKREGPPSILRKVVHENPMSSLKDMPPFKRQSIFNATSPSMITTNDLSNGTSSTASNLVSTKTQAIFAMHDQTDTFEKSMVGKKIQSNLPSATLLQSLSEYRVKDPSLSNQSAAESVNKGNAFSFLRKENPPISVETASQPLPSSSMAVKLSPAQVFVLMIKRKFSSAGFEDFRMLLTQVKEIQEEKGVGSKLEKYKQWVDAIHALFTIEDQKILLRDFSSFVPNSVKEYFEMIVK